MQFHVKIDGTLGRCTAQEGNCPFTSEGAEHFPTFQGASAHAENIFLQEAGRSLPDPRRRALSAYEPPPPGPEAYTVPWSVHDYMGSYIERGGTFLYQGTIYEALDWEWSRAILKTTIEALNTETGREETLGIYQGQEESVTFLNPKAFALRDGRRVDPWDLQDLLQDEDEESTAEEVGEAYQEGEILTSTPVTPHKGSTQYFEVRKVSWAGQDFQALYQGRRPAQEEEPATVGRALTYYESAWEAEDALDDRRRALEWPTRY